MNHFENDAQFADAVAAPTPPSPAIDVLGAAKTARALIAELTDQTIDAVSKVERGADGWTVEIDVLESRARIGDDDLLTAYAIELSLDGGFIAYRRLRRRRRFDDPSDEAA